MNVELVTRRQDLAALTPRWDELAQVDPRDGFFRTSTWYLSWLDHVRPDAQPFVVVVRNDAGEVVGLAPLCRLDYLDHGFRVKAVSSAGREIVSGDYLDYLAAAGCKDKVVTAVLDYLWRVRSEWGMLIVGEVIEGGDLHRGVEAFLGGKGLAVRYQEQRICPYIELPPTFEQYLSSLSQKMRYEVRRDTRDVLQKFGARIEVCTEPSQIGVNLDTLIQLHLAHWHSVNKPGTMGRSEFVRFLKQVCATPPAGSGCRLYLLKHEEKPVAALLAFRFGTSALFYQIGWDPLSALARFSPGTVLVAKSIRDAIEEGLRYYDFLRGDETYKCRLTKSYRRTITLVAARSLIAKQYIRLIRARDSFKQWIASLRNGKEISGAPTITNDLRRGAEGQIAARR